MIRMNCFCCIVFAFGLNDEEMHGSYLSNESEAHGILTHHTIASPRTVYSIGDLHGDYDCALAWVRHLHLIDFANYTKDRLKWQWIGGNDTVLVFVGDYIDRGPQSLPVVHLIRNLTLRWPERVVAILGNHEVYLLQDVERRRMEKLHHEETKNPSKRNDKLFLDYSYAVVHPEEFRHHLRANSSKNVVKFTYVAKLALETFYRNHMEESAALELVSRAMKHFTGRENVLIAKVEKKYQQKVDLDAARIQLEEEAAGAEASYSASTESDFTLEDKTEILPAVYRALDKIYAMNRDGNVFLGPPNAYLDGTGRADEHIAHYATLGAKTAVFRLADGHYKKHLALENLRRKVALRYAEWQDAYMASFAEDTEVGQWLQSRPLMTIAGRTLFVHGGIGKRFMPPLPHEGESKGGIESSLANFNSVFDYNRTSDSDPHHFDREMYKKRPLHYGPTQQQQNVEGLTANDVVTYRGMHRGNGLRGSSGTVIFSSHSFGFSESSLRVSSHTEKEKEITMYEFTSCVTEFVLASWR